MKPPYKITVEELEVLMREALKNDGWKDEYIEGYVDAQKRSGWLRQKCPQWLRDSAELFYTLPPASGF